MLYIYIFDRHVFNDMINCSSFSTFTHKFFEWDCRKDDHLQFKTVIIYNLKLFCFVTLYYSNFTYQYIFIWFI